MKSKTPLVSVVMLNYNGLKYLKRTIPPILKLDYPNYEFIIVDNGSTDGSIEFIKKFKKIRLIENGENLGYSKGKNIGVKHTKGEYVLLLDNDILINKKILLKNLLKFAQVHENSIITIPLRDFNKKKISYLGGFIYPLFDPLKFLETDKIKNSYFVCYPNGGAFFIKKTIWVKLKGFDEAQPIELDDKDLGIRAYIFGNKVIVFPEIVLIHLGYLNIQNLDYWGFRYKYHFSGVIHMVIKNFKFWNMSLYLIKFASYFIIKTIKLTIKKKSFKPILSFFSSIGVILAGFKDLLKQRKIVQSKRVIKEDIFLKIKPPKFD